MGDDAAMALAAMRVPDDVMSLNDPPAPPVPPVPLPFPFPFCAASGSWLDSITIPDLPFEDRTSPWSLRKEYEVAADTMSPRLTLSPENFGRAVWSSFKLPQVGTPKKKASGSKSFSDPFEEQTPTKSLAMPQTPKKVLGMRYPPCMPMSPVTPTASRPCSSGDAMGMLPELPGSAPAVGVMPPSAAHLLLTPDARCKNNTCWTPPSNPAMKQKRIHDDIGAAVSNKSLDMLSMALLSDHNTCRGEHIIVEAVRRQHLPALQFLLDPEQGNMTHALDENCCGRRPLHHAVQMTMDESDTGYAMMKLLLSKGARLDHLPNDGTRDGTALHTAVKRGCAAAVTLLLDHQADPNLADASGLTPLHLACRVAPFRCSSFHLRVVELLLRAGANPVPKVGIPPIRCTRDPNLRGLLQRAERHQDKCAFALAFCQPMTVDVHEPSSTADASECGFLTTFADTSTGPDSGCDVVSAGLRPYLGHQIGGDDPRRKEAPERFAQESILPEVFEHIAEFI